MTFKLDQGIPAPATRVQTKYPFAEMKPGVDSFAIPVTAAEQQTTLDRVRSAAAAHRRGHKDVSFVVRPVMEQDQLVVRCWCVKPTRRS